MLEADGYFKLAASDFKTAEAHLVDAEKELYSLLERLKACSQTFQRISGPGPLPAARRKSTVPVKGLEPVRS
ncbi:MAG TPA: hypothetical protein VJ377_03030 [Dehalococcoidales bacterium]|nr:hypothetical protein [Dehalococcoidales bacterium]